MTMSVAGIAAQTSHNYSAPIAILDSIFQGNDDAVDRPCAWSQSILRSCCATRYRAISSDDLLNKKLRPASWHAAPKQVPKLQCANWECSARA